MQVRSRPPTRAPPRTTTERVGGRLLEQTRFVLSGCEQPPKPDCFIHARAKSGGCSSGSHFRERRSGSRPIVGSGQGVFADNLDGVVRASLVAAGAGAPTVNRCLGILQGILQRAVEWRRLSGNPVAGVQRVPHTRDAAIDARSPEIVEAIRAMLSPQHSALVSVLAYEGLRPGEAFALEWEDVLEASGQSRKRLLIRRALSDHRLSTTKSQRDRAPELFQPVARDLLELYDAQGRPNPRRLVFPDSKGSYLRRQNWRRRVWSPALAAAGLTYFRPYDLRHTCATLLIYEGRTVNEVARHLGHADPGFTARTYAHVYEDTRERRVPIEKAIMRARVRAVFGDGDERVRPTRRGKTKVPVNPEKPTLGLEPRTPSLRVKYSVINAGAPRAAGWRTSVRIPANQLFRNGLESRRNEVGRLEIGSVPTLRSEVGPGVRLPHRI